MRGLESYGGEKSKTNQHRNAELDRSARVALKTLLGSSEATSDVTKNRAFFRKKTMLVGKPGTVILFDGGCVHEASSGEQDAASASTQNGGSLMRALHWLTPGAYCLVDNDHHQSRAQATHPIHPDMRAFLCEDKDDNTTATPDHVHAWARGMYMKEYEEWRRERDQGVQKKQNEATNQELVKRPKR